MTAVAFIDTSIWCEILGIPGKCDDPSYYRSELQRRQNEGHRFLVHFTTLVETGNHIGQLPSGHDRKTTAAKFQKIIHQAVKGEAPFTIAPFLPSLSTYLENLADRFPDWVMDRAGLGDLSLVQAWERQRELEKKTKKRVYIWSNDKHLKGYDTDPD